MPCFLWAALLLHRRKRGIIVLPLCFNPRLLDCGVIGIACPRDVFSCIWELRLSFSLSGGTGTRGNSPPRWWVVVGYLFGKLPFAHACTLPCVCLVQKRERA